MSKKFFVLIGITFFLFLILLMMIFLSSYGEKKKAPSVSPLPTSVLPTGQSMPTGTSEPQVVLPTVVLSIPPTDKVIISGVTVNNFFKTAQKINTYGDVLITDTGEYQIVYQVKFNTFLLSILEKPFSRVKIKAESEFVKVLGIKTSDACRLFVSITTPAFANPDEAGKEYGLSFCKK